MKRINEIEERIKELIILAPSLDGPSLDRLYDFINDLKNEAEMLRSELKM